MENNNQSQGEENSIEFEVAPNRDDEITAEVEYVSPDYSQIKEKAPRFRFKTVIFLLLKILTVAVILLVVGGVILGLIYYNNITEAYQLSFSAKDNLESAVHKIINREFEESADLIQEANSQLARSKELLDKVALVRYFPYVSTQMKAVDNLLIAGIKLTDSGEKVILLIADIVEPLSDEQITYFGLTPEQKKEILNKIVESEGLLLEVKGQIDEAVIAIDQIPDEGLVGPLNQGVQPLKENLPKLQKLIDYSLPMLKVIPNIVGFEETKSYLFLLQNNSELRPTGGFIGTYGILKLKDGEILELTTDNTYNLDQTTQHVLQEPSPEPIVKFLEQQYLSLRDVNWSPDFPTTAQKAIYMYREENKIIEEKLAAEEEIIGEHGVVLTELIIPYEDVDGVIAVTPEIIESILKVTGPITVEGVLFTDENLKDELEFRVGREYRELDIPISERKEIIKKLADVIKLKLMSLPLQRATDLLDIAFAALEEKQVLMYSTNPDLQELILERNWGGKVQQTEVDYLHVVDTNLGSKKTDQFVDRHIDYNLKWQGNDLIANVKLTYNNLADFSWKSTRLRSYTRIYVPAGSQLIASSGAMINDNNTIDRIINEKDFPEGVNEEEYIKTLRENRGNIDVGQELGKTVFGAFISIEPHETGVLSFTYKLPERIKQQINQGEYNLLLQKQAGVIHNLTLDLKFGKTIKSALPAELESEWFNTSYNYSEPLIQDKKFTISF